MANALPLQINAGDDLTSLASTSVYAPTQKEVYEGNVNQYADLMRSNNWDWNRTAADSRAPMIVDSQNHIVAGHHRLLAAMLAHIEIPEGMIKRLPSVTSRVPRPWEYVQVKAGFRP